jgi:hypothetical protein
MLTIVISHVTGVYLILVTKNTVSVQMHLDVNIYPKKPTNRQTNEQKTTTTKDKKRKKQMHEI